MFATRNFFLLQVKNSYAFFFKECGKKSCFITVLRGNYLVSGKISESEQNNHGTKQKALKLQVH